MRHFMHLSEEETDRVFFQKPSVFSKESPREFLALALGASLYMPGVRPDIHAGIVSSKHSGLVSMVICLEDAVGDHEVAWAESNVIAQLQQLDADIEKGAFAYEELPLIFVRVRSGRQMHDLFEQLGSAVHVLAGFVFPKFSTASGPGYIRELQEARRKSGLPLYGMPILESPEVIYKETRLKELMGIKELLDANREMILNVRMGATDFCGLYGIRRSSDATIYDISVVRDCIADIVNVFGRSEQEYIISGPVWEYFYKEERVLKPQLRETPFSSALGEEGLSIRKEMINQYMDGLIKEVLMDKNNGLLGKTVIHPTHIQPVHAFSVVSYEEYLDASSILRGSGQEAVMKSRYSNKMNEMKPHLNWAKKIMRKAEVYGVFHEQSSYIDLLREQELIHI